MSYESQRLSSKDQKILLSLAQPEHEKWRADIRRDFPATEHIWKPVSEEDAKHQDKTWIRDAKAKQPKGKENENKRWYKETTESVVDPRTGKPVKNIKREVDIFALDFNALNPSWKTEATASLKVALEHLNWAVQKKEPLDEKFVGECAHLIHIEWVYRNRRATEDFILENSASDNPVVQERVARKRRQLEPWDRLDDVEKKYDREAARSVLEDYLKRNPKAKSSVSFDTGSEKS